MLLAASARTNRHQPSSAMAVWIDPPACPARPGLRAGGECWGGLMRHSPSSFAGVSGSGCQKRQVVQVWLRATGAVRRSSGDSISGSVEGQHDRWVTPGLPGAYPSALYPCSPPHRPRIVDAYHARAYPEPPSPSHRQLGARGATRCAAFVAARLTDAPRRGGLARGSPTPPHLRRLPNSARWQ